MPVQIHRIRDERLSQKVIQQLLQLIRSGEIAIGGKLPPESALALQLGVSRGILREALTVMETRGFLKRTPREGTTVIRNQEGNLTENLSNQLKKATIFNLLDFREGVECKVVEKVIDKASDEDIEALADLIEKQGLELSSRDYYFHYRLAVLSGNPLFISFIDTYYDLIKEIRDLSLQVQDRSQSVQREHLRIVSALRKRDKAAARRATRGHLDAVAKTIAQRL